MVDTNNINITVSLSDDTLEKLAAIFSQANENSAWDPNPKVIEKPVSREVVVEQEPVQAQETGEDIYAGQCGLVFELTTQELRKSKAKRIDNKKNHRIGEASTLKDSRLKINPSPPLQKNPRKQAPRKLQRSPSSPLNSLMASSALTGTRMIPSAAGGKMATRQSSANSNLNIQWVGSCQTTTTYGKTLHL